MPKRTKVNAKNPDDLQWLQQAINAMPAALNQRQLIALLANIALNYTADPIKGAQCLMFAAQSAAAVPPHLFKKETTH